MTPKNIRSLQRQLGVMQRKLRRALPYDPTGKNDARAWQAKAIVQAFRDDTRAARKDAVANLLCALMHLADRDKRYRTFDASLERARERYRQQTKPPFRD